MPEPLRRSAEFSPCEQYRYVLGRVWQEQQAPCVFIMLNPSTADAEKDDPTIRRVMALSRGFGFGGVYILNLFAIRGSNPKIITQVHDPVGRPSNKLWWAGPDLPHNPNRPVCLGCLGRLSQPRPERPGMAGRAWGTQIILPRSDEGRFAATPALPAQNCGDGTL